MSRKVLSSLGRWRVLVASLLIAGMALMLHALTDPNEGLEVVAGSGAGSFELVWHGKPGRTYFIQTSDTLMPNSWTYLPAIESGTNAAIEWGFTNSTTRGFLRLRHTDQTYTGPVGAADFDTDGLTNNAELQTHHTDPLDGDSDDDGLNDGLEITLGTNPWSGDSDGDGVGDATENSNGSNPTDSTAQPNKEYWVKVRYWSSSQHHSWDTVDLGESYQESRWAGYQNKQINGTYTSYPNTYTPCPPEIILVDYVPPTNWGTPSDIQTGLTYKAEAKRIETTTSTLIDKEWRTKGYKLQLVTTQPMNRDYTLKLDVYRERREGSYLAPVTRTFVEFVTLTLPEGGSQSNAWEAVYAPELGFIDEYFITPRPEVKTQNITFGGTNYLELKSDDGQTTYRGTHWYDDNRDGTAEPEPGNYVSATQERNRPVAYVAGTRPKLSAKIRSKGITDSYSMQVRATINGTIDLPETWCYRTLDGYHTLEPTETTQALISNIGFYNAQAGSAFEIKWEFKKGTQWLEMATTKHTVYLVKAVPISTADALRRETLFNISCRMADGMSTSASDADIVNAIYGEFTNNHTVARVQRSSGSLQGTSMTYWGDPAVADVLPQSLYQHGDGRCGAWTRFFIDILRAQGMDATLMEMRAPQSPLGDAQQAASAAFGGITTPTAQISGYSIFYVKNWTLDPLSPFSPTDLLGVAGQGNNDPQSYFQDHYLVLHSGKIYDPSYGSPIFNNYIEWEDHALDGFGMVLSFSQNLPPFGIISSNPKWVWKLDPKGTLESIPNTITY